MQNSTSEIEKIFTVIVAIFACSSLVGVLADSAFYPHSWLLRVVFLATIVLGALDYSTFNRNNVFVVMILLFFLLFGTQSFESLHSIKALMLVMIALYIVISDVRKKIFHTSIIVIAKLHFVFHLLQFLMLYYGSDALVHSGQRTFYTLFLGFRAPGIFDEPSYASGFYMLATASVLINAKYDPRLNLRKHITIFALGSLITLSTGIIFHLFFLFWYLVYRHWQFYIVFAVSTILAVILISGASFSIDSGDAARARIIGSAYSAFINDPLNIITGLGVGGVETMFLDYNIYGSTTNSGLIDTILAMGLIGFGLGLTYCGFQLDIKNKNHFFHVCFFILPSLFSINYLQLIFWVYLSGLKRSKDA